MARLKNVKYERFSLAYIRHLNATQAAIEAGYSRKSAKQQGSRLLTIANIQDRIAELRGEYEASMKLDTEKVLERYQMIALADPNELTSISYGACRFCHGKGHQYHWRTRREYQNEYVRWAAVEPGEKASPAKVVAHEYAKPSEEGGFGYDSAAEPNPRCPECNGRGIPGVNIKRTDQLSDAARALFQGVKETRNGIEIKMADQMHALDQIGRHLGMFKDDTGAQAIGDVAAALNQIVERGSSAPIATPPEEDTVDDDE